MNDVLRDLQRGAADDAIRYPGERTLAARRRNLAGGVPVDPGMWEMIRSL